MRVPLQANEDASSTTTAAAGRNHKSLMPRIGRRPMRSGLVFLVAGATVVAAAVLLQQDVSITPSATAPDVVFAAGDDYSAINSAGFATLTIGDSSTSATLAVNGVPGAASVQLTDLLKITNQDGSQAYNVTLSRSGAPEAAITGFTLTLKDSGGSTVESWDAAGSASSSTFSLAASTTYDIDVDLVIADGTSVGALTGFSVQFELAPA